MRYFFVPVYFTMLFVAVSNANQKTATVTVIAEDLEGHDLDGARIEITQDSTNTTYRAELKDRKLKNVPSGVYQLTVFVPGYRPYARPLRVGKAELTVRAPMLISEYVGAIPVKGAVKGIGSCDDRTWLLVFPLMASPDGEFDALLDPQCRFSAHTWRDGPYLFVVLKGGSVVHTQSMFIGNDSKYFVIGKD